MNANHSPVLPKPAITSSAIHKIPYLSQIFLKPSKYPGVGAMIPAVPTTVSIAIAAIVAGFHSLVGLSAVLVGIVAFYNPASFGIGQVGNIKILSLVEMSLGVAIGAITFSGSCIAFWHNN